ncbi:MAG: two-component system response regulator [Clostridia bacterium BRH_c25]|nr:MAG: two-component system response regulator [Clostridia bacterium BRH_c25]
MFQVYIVENDVNLNHLFSLYLQKEGFNITSFIDGQKAFEYIDKCPHIWIVDSSLPDIDGYQILSEVKEKYPRIPVILMSERNSGTDRVIGLEMGCDDYLPKPFLPKELVIRVRKMLERTYGGGPASRRTLIYHIKPYMIDENKRIACTDSNIVKLTSKEFDLLLLFIKNPLRTFSRDQILKYIWGQDYFGSDRSVDDLVRRLRKRMKYLRIESVYGYGYRMLNNN